MPENNRSQNLLPGVPKIESPFFTRPSAISPPVKMAAAISSAFSTRVRRSPKRGEPNAAAGAYRQAIIAGRTGPDIDQWLGAAQRAMETMA